MAILRGGRAGGRELQAPDGLGVAGPARDEGRRFVVQVGPEVRAALRGRARLEARASGPHHGRPLTRPRRGITDEREPRWFPLIGRSLRDGPALLPVYGLDFSKWSLVAAPGRPGGQSRGRDE